MDIIIFPVDSQIYGHVINAGRQWLSSGQAEHFYQLLPMIILAIFLYIAYVYNQIFTHPNGIFTRLGWVDIDFFLPLLSIADVFPINEMTFSQSIIVLSAIFV